MLDVEYIDVSYNGAQVLFNVSLFVEKNEFVTLIGSNGSGKSTLLMTISGILKPSKGTITFLGEDITEKSPRDICNMGLIQVPEGRKIFPFMTVKENLELGAYLPKAREQLAKSLENVYELFPVLKERERQMAGTLSGGEQQQLAIGRALMARPKLLMLDEPTLGLAPKIVKELLEKLKVLKQRMSVLLVSQEVYQSLRVSDRTYVLENGRVVLEGESKKLLEEESIKKAYLGI
ncbi:ABC transporter ATP-binding protein [Archaeoglobales archaeon]|nr:MAG: ABC transporter ATP-binding protein [Archaeoglobales archaeon]